MAILRLSNIECILFGLECALRELNLLLLVIYTWYCPGFRYDELIYICWLKLCYY